MDPGAPHLLLELEGHCQIQHLLFIPCMPKTKAKGPAKDFIKSDGIIKVALLCYSSYGYMPNCLDKYLFFLVHVFEDTQSHCKQARLPLLLYLLLLEPISLS